MRRSPRAGSRPAARLPAGLPSGKEATHKTIVQLDGRRWGPRPGERRRRGASAARAMRYPRLRRGASAAPRAMATAIGDGPSGSRHTARGPLPAAVPALPGPRSCSFDRLACARAPVRPCAHPPRAFLFRRPWQGRGARGGRRQLPGAGPAPAVACVPAASPPLPRGRVDPACRDPRGLAMEYVPALPPPCLDQPPASRLYAGVLAGGLRAAGGQWSGARRGLPGPQARVGQRLSAGPRGPALCRAAAVGEIGNSRVRGAQ